MSPPLSPREGKKIPKVGYWAVRGVILTFASWFRDLGYLTLGERTHIGHGTSSCRMASAPCRVWSPSWHHGKGTALLKLWPWMNTTCQDLSDVGKKGGHRGCGKTDLDLCPLFLPSTISCWCLSLAELNWKQKGMWPGWCSPQGSVFWRTAQGEESQRDGGRGGQQQRITGVQSDQLPLECLPPFYPSPQPSALFQPHYPNPGMLG